MKIALLTFLFLTISISTTFAQRGKDGSYTVPSALRVVNTYAKVTSNASSGSNEVNVLNIASLVGANFTTPLAQGDLIMIVQMQGVLADPWDASNLNIYVYNAYVSHQQGEFNQTLVNSHQSQSMQNGERFGEVSNYANAGNFEIREVLSINGNRIRLTCALENTYEEFGNVQVVRIPRYEDLTIASGNSITCPAWDGSTGGVVAIEVNGDFVNNASEGINATAKGFRPGRVKDAAGAFYFSYQGSSTTHSNGNGNGDTPLGSNDPRQGGEIGESIAGNSDRYATFFSRFGRGAIANGGGGGGIQNAGGGGGSNVGVTTGTHTGKGVPRSGYTSFWNLEKANMATTISSGGGRGGYAYANTSRNPAFYKPNNGSWGGNARKENGGYGGRALPFNISKMYLGGGGGAGGQDSEQGGDGGTGGGIIHLTVYGDITGSGSIVANGGNGQKSNPNNDQATGSNRKGNDGAGGGGGGGFIAIKNTNPIPSTMSLVAQGGNGGDFALTNGPFNTNGLEVCGSGAGGAGGGIIISAGTPVKNVNGGLAGQARNEGSTHSWMTNFPMNGATDGGVGLSDLTNTIFDITASNVTICSSTTATLTATVTGTLPANSSVQWFTQQYGGTAVATGLTYTTPVITSTRTYYVGVCPGTFRIPVTVTVGASPVITGTAVVTNATCNAGGSITGLTVTGGSTPYTYTWNGVSATGPSLANASANNYVLVVTSANGCSATSATYTITGVGGPSITGTPTITNATCTEQGGITGLTVTSGAAITSYEWNGVATLNSTLSNASAGSYTLVVTDVNGCTAQSGPHTVGAASTPALGGNPVVVNANCNSGGSINGITVSGGVTPYIYSWTNTTQNTLNVSNLTQGNYTLTVTDANGCTLNSGPHTVDMDSAPTIGGAAVVTNQTCLSNGSITGLNATGGVGTLTYEWNGGSSTSATLASAVAGNYTLVVTDANGCSVSSGPHTVGAPNTISVTGTPIISHITCVQNGSVSGLTVNGGTGALTYVWNTTPSAGPTLSTNTAGSYVLNVVDAVGCTAQSGPHIINAPVYPSTPVVDAITNENCHGLGSINMQAITGVGPFTYSWNGQVTADISLSANAGTYNLSVTDANGCVVTSGPHIIELDPVVQITGTPTVVDATCNTTGSITGFTVTGGVGVITYEWNGVANTNANLTNASAGSYVLTATDANGCSASTIAVTVNSIGGPNISGTAVISPITCSAAGGISGIVVTGGTAPLTYTYNGVASSTVDYSVTTPGTYTLTVTDNNGCSVSSAPYVVNEIGAPTIGGTPSVTDVTCSTLGAISGFTVSGGTPDYSYSWNGQISNSANVTGLTAGTYVLVVQDANGCIVTSGSVTVGTSGNVPVVNGSGNVVHATCIDGGSISGLTVTGGTAPYVYSWNGQVTNSISLTDVDPGTYILTITDANGCTTTSSEYTVSAAPIVTIAGSPDIQNADCVNGGNLTGLTVNAGTAPYVYSWNGNISTSLNLINVAAGNYNLVVTDAAGCTATSGPFVIGQSTSVEADFTINPNPVFINEVINFHDESTGNIIQWDWLIDTMSFTAQHPTYVFGKDGFYTVSLTVLDANGCVDTKTVTIEVVSETVVPNIITANGDGVNDFFVLKGLVPNTKLIILNRWGNLIFESDNYDNLWSGYDLSGNMATEGVYTYAVTMPNGNQKHGFIHIVGSK